MHKMDIKHDVEGNLLLRAEYSMHFHQIFKDFEEKFDKLDKLYVLIKEVPNFTAKGTPNVRNISEDGKSGNVIINIDIFHRGTEPYNPSPQEVFKTVESTLDKLVED